MKNEIIKKAIEILKDMESGDQITILELAEKTKLVPASELEDTFFMIKLTYSIIEEAEKENIFLDSVYGDDIMGVPYNIPYAIKRKYDSNAISKENCVALKFRMGGYMTFKPALDVKIEKDKLMVEHWDEIMTSLFDRCKVQKWFDQYVDHTIMDGYYWNLELRFSDGTVAKYTGSNQRLRGLATFAKIISPWSEDKALR